VRLRIKIRNVIVPVILKDFSWEQCQLSQQSQQNWDFSLASPFPPVSRNLFAQVIACVITVPHISFDVLHLQLAMNASFKWAVYLSGKCTFYWNVVIRLLYNRLCIEFCMQHV
jgi:hypothetical protein